MRPDAVVSAPSTPPSVVGPSAGRSRSAAIPVDASWAPASVPRPRTRPKASARSRLLRVFTVVDALGRDVAPAGRLPAQARQLEERLHARRPTGGDRLDRLARLARVVLQGPRQEHVARGVAAWAQPRLEEVALRQAERLAALEDAKDAAADQVLELEV